MAGPRPPLVISCQGGTRLARLARDAAAALDDRGVAEATNDLEQVVTAARAGRRVMALDGCASACRARLLEARDVRSQAAVNLAELGVSAQTAAEADPIRLADEAMARLRSRPATRRRRRPSRPTAPPVTPGTKRPHLVGDYLLAIDSLASITVECGALAVDAPALAAHVSRLLAVSRASAGEMVTRLEVEGLVERGAHRELLLTTRGREAADRAVRRHRLLERFASDFLGYSPAECYEEACFLDGAFDDDAIERLRRALGDPERCPHGWPIDPQRAREESRELAAISALQENEQATVVRVVECDGALLTRLYRLGLTPGARLTLGRRRAGANDVAVLIEGTTRHLDAAAAAGVFVRRQA